MAHHAGTALQKGVDSSGGCNAGGVKAASNGVGGVFRDDVSDPVDEDGEIGDLHMDDLMDECDSKRRESVSSSRRSSHTSLKPADELEARDFEEFQVRILIEN